MNKKLLTLAVAGAIVGGMGVAQADVTVYGKAAVSIDSVHVDSNTGFANDGNLVVSNNSSRLGFKFSEDLGGSFFKKAIGQYEATVAIDGEDSENSTTAPNPSATTTGIFGGAVRNSFLGLETAGGTIMAGIYDTPFKIVGRNVELFPEYVGDARNLTSPGGATWDLRLNNVIAYSTPTMAGVNAMLAYSADTSGANTVTDANVNRAWSASVSYKGGPVYVGAAYEVHAGSPGVAPTAAGDNENAWRLAASGTFGMFKVVALYQQLNSLGGLDGVDRSVYGLGGAVTLAEKHVIKAQYYNADPTDNATTDNGAQMYAVGYDYKFSKKTTGYVAYAKTDNDAAGAYGVNGGGHGDTTTITAGSAAAPSPAVSAVSVGMYMDF